MDKTRVVLIGVLFGLAVFTAPASADDDLPCPATVEYFRTLYIDNGLNNWPYQEWVENSQLYRTDGSGSSAECYYVGALYSAHPEQELRDPQHHWHINYLILAAQL